MGTGYVARVQARNEHGWGPLSEARHLDASALKPVRPPLLTLTLALAALLALALAIAAAVFYGKINSEICVYFVPAKTNASTKLKRVA